MSLGLDFWQWAALTGLGLTGIGVVLGGVGLWASARQTKAITGQIGATTHLIAGAEERTQRILVQMETNAEARYRDLKDRLGGETEGHA
jgi:hypothetical protein